MYYSVDGDLMYCNNIQELMEELQLKHTSEQWRLFINSSKVNLKELLLHSVIKVPSVRLAHVVTVKEPYENLQGLV